jgi:type VI secretion system secreted protein Hcp
MPIPTYATFDGIEGSCQVKGREGTVEVLEYNHIVEIPVDVKDSSATGTRRHGPVKLVANVDKATTGLMECVCTSKAIPTVELAFFQIGDDGKQTHYYNVKLENVRVTNTRMWFPNVDDAPTKSYKHMVDYELRYEKITWTFMDGNLEFSDAWKEPVA